MLATAAVLFAVGSAPADYPPTHAALAYQRASEFYDAGDYETSLKWLVELSEARHDVMLLFNIAMTHYKLNNCSMARTFYRRFLHHALRSGLMAPKWWIVDPNRERYLKLEQKLVECIDQQPTSSGMDMGAGPWPTPGLW